MDDPLIPVPIPALVVILLNREKKKGSALSREEVESTCDKAVCMMLLLSKVKAMEVSRGYADIDPQRAWAQWQEARIQLGQSD